jgi:hypothetical protein
MFFGVLGTLGRVNAGDLLRQCKCDIVLRCSYIDLEIWHGPWEITGLVRTRKRIVVIQAQFAFTDFLAAPSPPSRACCGGHRGSTSAQPTTSAPEPTTSTPEQTSTTTPESTRLPPLQSQPRRLLLQSRPRPLLLQSSLRPLLLQSRQRLLQSRPRLLKSRPRLLQSRPRLLQSQRLILGHHSRADHVCHHSRDGDDHHKSRDDHHHNSRADDQHTRDYNSTCYHQ